MRFIILSLVFLITGCGTTLHRFQSLDESENGFGMFRSGQPKMDDLKNWCDLKINYIFALNGRAEEYQSKLHSLCSQPKIVFDQVQDPDSRIDTDFLREFDSYVDLAKTQGEKILFHCNCGCHRTGRLAAYYRMKYNNWSAEDALREMNGMGKDMDEHPSLEPQVRALYDYIHHLPCSQDKRYCF